MAITRAKKESIVQDLHQKTEGSDIIVFFNFHGLGVSKITQLRKALRESGAEVKVAKKRLVKRVLDGFGFSGDLPTLEGELAVMFKSGDVIDSVKILHKFLKDKQFGGLKILGGVFEKSYVGTDTVKALATIPSRDELIGQLVYLVASPLRGLVGVLSGPMRNMVGVLHNLSKKT